ncbi:MAG: EAL domain-containing protein [Halomonas sp.]
MIAHPLRQAAIAFEHAPVGLAMVDGTGRLLVANPRFCELVGLSSGTLRGRRLTELLPMTEALALDAADDASVAWYALQHDLVDTPQGDLLLAVSRGADAQTRLLTLVPREDMPNTPAQDALTGTTSPGLFQDRFCHAIDRAERLDQPLALLVIQLDKPPGAVAGGAPPPDAGLVFQVTRRIQRTFRREDTVAWLGQYRWAVLIEHPVTPESLQTVALRCQEAMDAPLRVADSQQLLTTSIGIARYPDDAEHPEELMQRAEAALNRAARACPGNHEFFERRLRRRLEDRSELLAQLQEALLAPARHFHLNYQPQFHLASGHCIGLEALVRWQHPRLGLLYPRDILPMAAELDQLIRLDRWVLEQVIQQHGEWQAAGSPLARLGLSVNLDTSMLAQSVFDGRPLDHYLRQQAVALEWLNLEIQASGLALSGETHLHLLKRVGRLGVSLTADAIGMAPLSLPCLAALPLSRAKLNRELVSVLGRRASSARMLSAVTAGLQALALETVAVGVETEGEYAAISALGITAAQGNYLSPPMMAGELEAWHQAREEGGAT